MTLPRPILEGCTYMITRRCAQRVFLLRADDEVNAMLAYVLLWGAEKYGIRIIAGLAMSNHWHVVVCDPHGVLPAFLRDVHSLLARALNCKLGRMENFWDVEQVNINHLVETHDVVRKATYVLTNPVTAHLVETSREWPGFNTYDWLDGRTVTVKRPTWFFGKRSKLPLTVSAKLVAPPAFKGSFDAWATVVRAAVEEKEWAAAAERAAEGINVVGATKVRWSSRDERSRKWRVRKKVRPFVAAKNPTARAAKLRALEAFRRWHAFARAMFVFGWREVPFPPGTWAMVHIAGVSVAPS